MSLLSPSDWNDFNSWNLKSSCSSYRNDLITVGRYAFIQYRYQLSLISQLLNIPTPPAQVSDPEFITTFASILKGSAVFNRIMRSKMVITRANYDKFSVIIAKYITETENHSLMQRP